MRKKIVPYVLLIPQILLTILFLIGLWTGITQSLGVIPAFGLEEPTLRYYIEVLSRPDMLESVLYSLKIAFVSAAVSTIGGVFLCASLTMNGKAEGFYGRLIQLPIIVPHVVVALFVINIFAQNGILARLFYAFGWIAEQQDFPRIIYSESGLGVILAYVWKELPFIVYFVISLMGNINGTLGEAARNLGASKWQSFFKVTLPLCKDTILSGFLIIFVFSLGAYELPVLLGATLPKALPVLAYNQYTHPNLQNRPYAMALNGIIIVISLLSAVHYFVLMERSWKDAGKERQ